MAPPAADAGLVARDDETVFEALVRAATRIEAQATEIERLKDQQEADNQTIGLLREDYRKEFQARCAAEAQLTSVRADKREMQQRSLDLCRRQRLGDPHAYQVAFLIDCAERLLRALKLDVKLAEELAFYWFDQRGIALIGGIVPGYRLPHTVTD